LGLISFTINI